MIKLDARLMVVTDQYPPELIPAGLPEDVRTPRPAYAGIFIREQAEALAKIIDVEIAALLPYWCSVKHPFVAWREYGALGVVRRENVVKESFSFWPCRSILTRPFMGGSRARLMARALARILAGKALPDLMHAHFACPVGWAVGRIASEHGVPYLLTVHESYLDEWTRWRHVRRALRHTMDGAARIVVPSSFQRGRILSLFPECEHKTVVIPNGVDTDRFRPRSNVACGGPARLTFIGNLYEVKGIATLARAARCMVADGFDYRLSVVGDGPLRQEIEQAVDPLGDRVRFVGTLGRDGLAALLREGSDILIVSSRRETFCVAVIEALASGVPVVATRCGGPEETVTEGVGRLVPVADAGSLAEAVRDVWERRGDYLPDRIAAYARDKFSQDKIAARLMDLYREVLRERQ